MTMKAADRSSTSRSQGFSLVELLVALAIAMVILAGLYTNFFLQSRVQSSQSSSVDALEDLRLASNIMASQLRMSVNMCWDPTNGLVYQPLGANVMNGCSGTLDQTWGAFAFQTTPYPRVVWKRPGTNASVELLRGLDPTNGFSVSPQTGVSASPVIRTLTLVSQYQNIDRQNRTLQIRFNVFSRNE